jgi:peptidoglycan/xylan/chitin deacetylase (PgdA/CDA1 family)
MRDLRGYGDRPPDPRWPDRARVAVSLVVNLEEGAEFSVAEGDPRNEAVYEVIDRIEGNADPCIESHFDYGIRAGWWRVMDVLKRHGAMTTVSACGRALERSPWLGEDAVRRGHEVSAHGWRWEGHVGMSESDERECIRRTVRAITDAAGVRPVGWHTRSAASVNTRRLVVEEGGFLYDSDYYGDDLPVVVEVAGRRHVVMPYSFDTNDMHFWHTNRFVRGSDFVDYVIAAFDWLWREGAHAPKMMSVGLHLRMIGRPGRIGALDTILSHFVAKGGAWIARRDQIARHWLSRVLQA